MLREISDKETIRSLVQAYAGLKEGAEESVAAYSYKENCLRRHNVWRRTNSALELKSHWQESLSDEGLIKEIKFRQE